MTSKTKHLPVTDVLAIFLREAEKRDMDPTTLSRIAFGSPSYIKSWTTKAEKSANLEKLDRAAIKLGYDDFVHMAAAQPRIDPEILAETIELTLQFAFDGQRLWPAEWITKTVLTIYQAKTDPARDHDPTPTELAALIFHKLGFRPGGAPEPAG